MPTNQLLLAVLVFALIFSMFFSSNCFFEIANAMSSSIVSKTAYRDYWPAYAQRTFYAAGHFWVFWFNCTDYNSGGGYEAYSSSSDGQTWATSIPVENKWIANTRCYSIWFDGTYVHNVLAWIDQYHNSYLSYRRGTPNADGLITWSPAQAVVNAPTQITYDFVQISVDSNSYPWITFETLNYADGTSVPYTVKSSTNDGTWKTTSGFPFQLASGNTMGSVGPKYGQAVYPFDSGKMVALIVYERECTVRVWNNAAWEKTVIAPVHFGGESSGIWQWSAVPQGDFLHITYIDKGIGYLKYDYSTNSFIDEATLNVTGITAFSHLCISLDSQTSNLYVFYENYINDINSDSIRYVTKVNNLWSSKPLILLNDTIASAFSISVNNNVQDGYIPIMYNRVSDSNIYTLFAALSINSIDQVTIFPTPPTEQIGLFEYLSGNWLCIILLAFIAFIVILSYIKKRNHQ